MSNVPREKGGPDRVAFTHQSAFNEIVQPTAFVSLTHYFIANWLPKISPNGLRVLVTLRSMGYFNPKSGEKRGEIDIEQEELASLVGISAKTIQRAFADDEVLNKYVRRVFSVQRDRFGRILKEHYVYLVTMDDVLTEQDEARYRALLAGPDKAPADADGGAASPKRQSVPSGPRPNGQVDASGGQSVPPKRQSVPPERQGVAHYKESLTLLTENTFITPAAPDFSLSLFPGQDPPGGGEDAPGPITLPANPPPPARRMPRPWPQLPDVQREPYFVQARRELEAIYLGSGLAVKPKLIEVRAKNIYEEEGKAK